MYPRLRRRSSSTFCSVSLYSVGPAPAVSGGSPASVVRTGWSLSQPGFIATFITRPSMWVGIAKPWRCRMVGVMSSRRSPLPMRSPLRKAGPTPRKMP